MKKIHIIAILITIAIIMAAYIGLNISEPSKDEVVAFNREKITIHTKTGDRNYDTEIAKTTKQMARGLMFRESINENEAMIFLFDHPHKINMWMKNTLIPLDMLFIDNSGKVVYIAHNATPKSLSMINAGEIPVISVMELKGGIAQKHNINIGDKVIYGAFTQ